MVAVCDRHLDLARQAAARFDVPTAYDSVAAMLLQARPDVVHITTPPHSHQTLTLECLQGGAHVYVEKPFTVNLEEADAVLEAAARYSFLLAVPAVFGSGFYQLAKSWGEPQHVALAPTIVATAVAFLAGYIVIVAFLKLVSRASFIPFVIYRTVLGLALLALLQLGVITP